ncbi:MAG: hypothetical protein K0R75_1656 [Paenibacillaceae bacterium]|jgi:hypothetical protein|nr:hypothetical protein [Paenibacillaceae bacterium]
MAVKVILSEKFETGELKELDQREWSQDMLISLNNANYLLVNNKEYEMIEGRLNVTSGSMEVLVIAVKPDNAG